MVVFEKLVAMWNVASFNKQIFEDVTFLALKMEDWVTSQKTQVGLEGGKGMEIMIL